MTDVCGCCAGITHRTPLKVWNRPGLSAIAYRVGEHPEFLASMVAGLTDGARPRLAALTSGGAIPEVADYRVLAEPDETFIGTVNEDWAMESMAGDVFLLGTHTWRIRKVESGVGHAQKTPLKGLRFETAEEAQAYLDRWEERWADTRIHGTTKRQVAAIVRGRKTGAACAAG